MTQPHHSVNHFIQQLDSKDNSRRRKPQMPSWLKSFIWQTTEHFDPIGCSARAGYIVAQEENRWVVRLFLGETEVVGGPQDGAILPTAFTFDLEAVRQHFETIHRMEWNGLPSDSLPEQSRDDATISIDGTVCGLDVRLLVDLRSPADLGPGLKRHSDGTLLPS